MIIVKLTGGLGNQMFQYAAAKKIALLHKTILKSDILEYQSGNLRRYELGCFELDLQVAVSEEIELFIGKDPKINFKKIKYKITRFFKEYKYIKQPQFYYQYHSGILASSPNTYLEGYWQSEKYFESIDQKIRHDFTFKSPLSGKNKILAEQIVNENSVSIHIRRGDYINNDTTNEFHGLCSIEYYKNSIRYMQENTDQPGFYIFSDDSDWVKENLRIENSPVVFVADNKNENSFEDMRLMSLCKHNIIANSSFSWWAAWLNANPAKMVLAPEKWFNPESRWYVQYKINTSDILPEKWIRISE